MSILINNKVVAGSQPLKEIGLDNLSSELVDLISQRSSDLFDIKYSDHILEGDEAIGWALQGTYVYKTAIAGQRYGYPDFYARCLDEKAAATPTETALGSSTITLYVHTNGHKFYDIADKAAVDAWFNTYGIADFFGIDTVNQCIFLPRNNYFFQLTTDVSKVNDLKEAGLPNITGKLRLVNEYNFDNTSITSVINGAFSTTVPTTAGATINQNTTPSNDGIWAVTFDASRSSDVYGNSNTVQPQSSLKLLYYRVGNTINSVSGINLVEQVEEGIADIENAKNNSVTELTYVTKQSLKDVQDTTNDGLSSLANASNALRETQITNCIKEIPQRIKTDVLDGTLTVYAGSVAIVPYGTTDRTSEFPVGSTFIHENFKVVDTQFADGKFFVWVEVQNNISGTPTATDTKERVIILYVNASTLDGAVSSGSGTAPSGSLLYYNTSTNLVEYLNSGANTDGNLAAFPLGRSQADGTNKFASITQTFNGIGYIGSTYWVDKGYKGLISNRRNSDLTCKNIEWNNDKLTIYTFESSKNYPVAHMAYDNIKRADYMIVDSNNWVFDKINNIWKFRGSPLPWIDLGTCTVTNGVISNFNPKQPVRLLDGSGDINMDGNLLVNSGFIAIKAPTIDANTLLDTTPSANNYYSSLSFKDKNDVSLAGINCYHSTANNNVIRMAVNSVINGEIKSAQIAVGVESADGLANFSFPKCTTKATTTSTATSNRVAVVVQNYKSGTTWYRVWSDGWIEQGGRFSTTSSKTVTFPKAFVDTNYNLTWSNTTGTYSGSTQYWNGGKITSKTASNFAFTAGQSEGPNIEWVAFGY